MKIILVSINAKYEHEGLAVWYLKAACQNRGIPAKVMQYSINDSTQRVWASIMDEKPDVAAFSCYIWNRGQVLNLISDLKKARPQCVVIAGGPEVSYEGSEADFKAAGAEFVIKWEGEGILPVLLENLEQSGLESAQRRFESGEITLEDSCYFSPFVPEYLERIKDRIAYIESSRGCPYKCSYCLSSESRGMILFPLESIKSDIEKLVRFGARVIKFVDRSFNVHEARSLEIWSFIRKFSGRKVTFHFEINPDRLTPLQLEALASMPAGLVQVEAGIQSVNAEALKEVSRVMDVEAAVKNLKFLMKQGNIHVHTDLIAGLPYESLESFRHSFNRIYEIKAHNLQLGFLKLIHGTRIRREAEKHAYKFRHYPPYEVIENRYLSAEDILVLKGVEEILDRAYNSGRLTLTLEYLLGYFSDPFAMYQSAASFFKQKGLLFQPLSAAKLFELFREFASGIMGMDRFTLDSFIALDYACSLKNTVFPEFLENSRVQTPDSRELLECRLGGWKKEYRKRFLVLQGNFLIKNSENFQCLRNRMLVDTARVDPVTERAIPQAI